MSNELDREKAIKEWEEVSLNPNKGLHGEVIDEASGDGWSYRLRRWAFGGNGEDRLLRQRIEDVLQNDKPEFDYTINVDKGERVKMKGVDYPPEE